MSAGLYALHVGSRWGGLYNVVSTSMQRHDVASTLRRRCRDVMCPLGCMLYTLDPDGVAYIEPSHLDTHSLPF